MKTIFSGGVRPPTYKSITKDKKIRPARIPKKVILPLSQHTGKPSRAVVKAGDYVDVGTRVAEPTGFVSAGLHSPVSGTVKAIEQAFHPTIGTFPSVIIEPDGKQKQNPLIKAQPEGHFGTAGITPERIIQAISDGGIVGMGGAAFPTHVKLSPPKETKVDTLIINGAECEPYLTCDHRLMLERAEGILKGAMIMCKALGINNCLIGIESNKPDAVIAMRNASIFYASPLIAHSRQGELCDLKVVSVPARYPQGAERQLIKTLLNREVPCGGLPFEIGVVVQNVATALAVYEAVALNKPLYERVVTLSGDCLKEPANLLVKIGTAVGELVDECGGFIKEPAKVIFGGPMMGVCQWTLDVPVLKGTSGVLFLSRDIAAQEAEGVCIRCGGCARVCPAGLEPTNIYYAAAKNRFDLASGYSAPDCIECGACSFECPAKLDLVGMIKYAKLMIRENERK